MSSACIKIGGGVIVGVENRDHADGSNTGDDGGGGGGGGSGSGGGDGGGGGSDRGGGGGSKVQQQRHPEAHNREKENHEGRNKRKQGRIHGNPVADGWAGAVMRNRSEFKILTFYRKK